MTAPEFDDNQDPDDEQQPEQEPTGPKPLRERFKTVSAENATLKRDLAFIKAGLPDTPVAKLVQEAYKGELDAAAIRKFAVEHGVLPADNSIPDAELDAQDRVQQLSKDGTPVQHAPDMNAAIRRASGR